MAKKATTSETTENTTTAETTKTAKTTAASCTVTMLKTVVSRFGTLHTGEKAEIDEKTAEAWKNAGLCKTE